MTDTIAAVLTFHSTVNTSGYNLVALSFKVGVLPFDSLSRGCWDEAPGDGSAVVSCTIWMDYRRLEHDILSGGL
jgi:hypothetical protein